MQIITASDAITLDQLKSLIGRYFIDMVKAVVDIERKIMAVDAELHSDLEGLLLSDGSRQKDLWGVNFYPDLEGDDFIEFDSMINMRPSQGNRSRGVEDLEIQKAIRQLVALRVKR